MTFPNEVDKRYHPPRRPSPSFAKKLGAAILEYREWTGKSQRDISQMIDLEHSSVSKLERGQRHPSVWILENLAKAGVLTVYMSKHGTQIKAVMNDDNKRKDREPEVGGRRTSAGVHSIPGGAA